MCVKGVRIKEIEIPQPLTKGEQYWYVIKNVKEDGKDFLSKNIEEVFQENANNLGVGNPYWQAIGALESLKGVMQTFRLSMPEWPDLTQLFNMAPAPAEDTQQTPIGSPALSPRVYNRPSLTLNPITGLTRSQTALLSPADLQY